MPENNPYLSFLESRQDDLVSTTPPGAENPYLSALEQQEQAGEIRKRATVGMAVTTNPELEAQTRSLAKALGVEPAVVQGLGLDEAKRQDALRKVQESTKQAPALSRAYTREDFARLAHDDSDNLSALERVLTEIGGRGIMRGAAQDKAANLGFRKATGQKLTTQEEIALQDAQAKMSRLVAGQEGRGLLSYLLNTTTYTGTQLVMGLPFALAGAVPGAAAGAGVGASGAAIAGQMGPQVATLEEVVTVPAAAVGGAVWGGRTGFVAGQSFYNYRIETGMAYLEYSAFRDEAGQPIDKEIATGAAHLTGVLNMGFETVADLTLYKLSFPGLDKLLSAPAKDTVSKLLADEAGRGLLKRLGQRVGTAATVEGFTEAVQETVNILVGEGAKVVSGGEFETVTPTQAAERVTRAAIEGAIGGGGVTTVTAPIQLAIENREIKRRELEGRVSEREIGRVQAAVEAAANSKLAQRDRDELQRFIDDAAAESPVSTVYITPDSLAQTAQDLGLDVRAVAAQLGVSDQLQDAALTGSDIQISVGKFISTVAGTDLAAPMLEIVKTDPFLYSRTEIKQLQEAGNEDVIASAKQLVNSVLTDQEFRSSAAAVRSQVFKQLRATMRWTDDVNTVYAAVTAQGYLTAAQRLGITPEEAFARVPLQIAGARITGQMPGAFQQEEGWQAYRGGAAIETYSTDNIQIERPHAIDFGYGIYLTSDISTAELYAGKSKGVVNKLIVRAPQKSLLDRDLTLAEQSDFVKTALVSAGLFQGNESKTGKELYDLLTQQNTPPQQGISLARSASVGPLKAANATLQAVGIRGMKYLAAYGRGNKNPNYVIFDGADIVNAPNTSANILTQAQAEGYAGQDTGEAQEWVRARAKGLDMSQSARMERAKAMGFDTETVLYHGTTYGFDEFTGLTFLTEDPEEGSAYGNLGLRERERLDAAETAARTRIFDPGDIEGQSLPYTGIFSDVPPDQRTQLWATDQGIGTWIDGNLHVAKGYTVEYGTPAPEGYGYILARKLQPNEQDPAEEYFKERVDYAREKVPTDIGPTNVVMPLYARSGKYKKIDNPFEANILGKRLQVDLDKTGRARLDQLLADVEQWKQEGYIGIDTMSDEGAILGTPIRQKIVFNPSDIRSVNAAFDPDFSESANILAQTVNAPRQLEDNPVAFGLTPEQAKKVNPIYNPKTLPVERLPSNQEAALWLEGNYIGDPVTDLTAELSDEQIKEIATIMAAEAQLALGNTGNAFTWYSSALAKALDIISIKYPMLADDAAAAEAGLGTSRNARFVFTYIMAVTSQNLDVAANSVATDKAFGDMLKRVANGNFTMPRSWGTGDKQKAMGENFAKFGPLIDKMPGDDFPSKLAALDDLFRVKMTVKEWVAYMKQEGVPYNKPGQTAMDAVVYGSSLLGPKIGNGFWQNLNGNYDPMTIDLWMRRTWGRLTGKSIGNPAALPEQRARLAGAIKRSRSREQGKPDHIAAMAAKIAATEKQLDGLNQADFASKKEFAAEQKRLKAEIKDNQEALADLANLKAPETWSAEYNTSNDALLAYAKRLLKAWNVEYERLKEGSKSGTVPAEAQPTWARAAKTIITNLAKPLDQVANGTQRKQIERAGKEALRILQERGITLTTADLQAILWYPEKELWGSLTAELETDEDGDPVVPPSSLNESYDTAFSRILKEQGYEIQGIAGDGGGGLGAGAVARQDGGPQQPASSGRVGAPGGAIAERGPDTLGQEQISGRRPQQLGARDGRRAYSSGGLAPLEGSPAKTAGPDPSLVTVAEDYAAANGIPFRRPARFAELDVDRAQRIAAAFDAMQHAPNDPAVREAYENLKRQTRAQYDALIAAGYVFTFYDGDTDPYAGNPMNAMRDLRNNKRMAVYGTYSGYGTEGVTEGDRADNPMLEDAGLKWPDQNGAMQPVTANDLFRAVHDAFGHGLEAAGFRARGEENAWQAHMRLYTGSAVGAATTELRGQNSWLNYGPYGETNRTAKVEDTVFAENKIGLMPEWTWTEGRVEDMPEQPDTLGQAKRNLDALGFYSAVQEAAKLIPDNVWKMGWPAARSALAKGGAGIAPRKTELQYLNLDAMFGDTKLRGQALKEAVEEHIAANRLSLVENFARFDPNNIPVPTKRVMLQELENNALAYAIGLQLRPMGEGRVSIETNIGEVNSNLYLQRTTEALARPRYYDLIRYYDGGRREVIASGVERDLRGQIARLIVDENFIKAERKISAAALADEWRASFDNKLVRGAGDIRLPGEDVPLFEAVIGIPEGVPGADYQAPISHVGGKAKGTLVTAHGEERIDDKGQRTIFVGQVQSDMAQGKREEKKDLEASAKALRVLENNPNANLFLYTGGQIRVASAEDAADVPYAATLLSRDQVKEMYKTEGARIETPLITTSEWTNVAVRAMIYRAAREGFESISFPTGETSAIIQGNDAAAQHYETNVKGALEKLAKQLGEEVRKGGVATNLDDVAEVNARAEEERLIQQTAENMGIPEEEFANFRKELIEEGQFYDRALSEERAKAQMASAYILDLTPAMREKIMSEGFPLFQERRGEYVPSLNEIRLNPQADLSTYLHELGHHFLEMYNTISLELVAKQTAGETLTDQEQLLVDDTRRLITEIARQTNTAIDGEALTWWNSLAFEQRVPMHEQFARLTEAYFLEGKAPTPELQGMFQTIKRWMMAVYRSLKELNVELSPEVTQVMDRMWAASADIATAERNRGLNRMFSVKPEFMTDQEWEAYQQIAAQATTDAEEELTARSLRDMQWLSNARSRELRKLQRAASEKRKTVEAEVTAEVMELPVNRARTFLKRGLNTAGEEVTGPHKLSISQLKERFPEGSGVNWQALGYGKYGMLANEGLDPDTAAELLGYPSGGAMIQSLLSAEPAETVIEAETDRRMLERYGDLSDDAAMGKAADEAIHNGLRSRVLQAEYAALAKAANRSKALVANAKQIAQQMVGKLNAAKLNANKFLAAERAAGRKAEAALRKNDLVGAATAKRDQLLNFEIAREVQRVIKQRDRALDLFTRIVTAKRDTVSKTRNYDLVQAARAILSAYGMGRVQNDALSYLEAIKSYDPKLYSALEPMLLKGLTTRETLDQLTVDQLLGLRDVVKQLWDLSREEMTIEIEGKKVEKEAIVSELNTQLEAQGVQPKGFSTEAPTEWQKRMRQFAGLKSSMRRVESWAKLFDRGKVAAFTRYIWRPVSEAADRYRIDRNKYIIQFRELFRAIEPTMGGGKINAQEINYTFTNKAELLHAVLHTGNSSNYRKLLLGRGWGELDANGVLIDNAWTSMIQRLARENVLTKADFDFAQGVWDLLEDVKPLAQQAHRQVFGRYFAEITAEPVQTPFGTYRGGYVPAIYDPYNEPDAAVRAQQDAVEANDSTMFPSPANGFTKGRVEYNRELLLDLRLLPQHIDTVLKFAHLAAPVRGVNRLLRDKGFSKMLASADPTAQSDMLLPWLTRAARQIVEKPSEGLGGQMVDGFFRGLRQRSGMGLMFANFVNVAQQVTGFSLAALTVKPKYLASGLVRYIRSPKQLTETIRQASPMMADRGDNQLAAMYGEIDKIIDKNDKYGQARDWFGRHTYFLQQGVQNVMDIIVWAGAYDQALAEGQTEQEAAKRGDAAVRQTQGSTLSEDISRAETGDPILRSFTHMYTYFNMWGNLLSTEMRTAVRQLGLKKGAGRLLYIYMAGFAVPALFAQVIADGLRGQLPEDEDDDGWLDEWLSWFFMTQSKTALAFAPVVGQAGSATLGALTEAPYDDRVGGSPAISAIEAGVRTVATPFQLLAGQELDASRKVKDTLTLLTLTTGLPFQVLGRPVGYAVDVAEGDITPTSGADYVRGLVTGAASEASR